MHVLMLKRHPHLLISRVQQELLARMLTQVKAPCDPIKAHCHDNSTINTCSTCSPTPDRQDMALGKCTICQQWNNSAYSTMWRIIRNAAKVV